jgi:hypothetical protein
MRAALVLGALLSLVACGGSSSSESSSTTTITPSAGSSGTEAAGDVITFESQEITCTPGATVASASAYECPAGASDVDLIRGRLSDGVAALSAACTAAGSVTVHWVIGGDGAVTSAEIVTSTGAAADANEVLQLVRGTTFCAFADGQARTVTHPFVLAVH